MMKSGLVSVSFRQLKVNEIIELCAKCGLGEIEWGGDIHVPLGDLKAAREVSRLTRDAGLDTCCYGSYVRMTQEERPMLPSLVETADALEAPSIRVWAGKTDDAELDEIAESAQMLCDMAKDKVITFEFHGSTLTHSAALASLLLNRVNRPNIRTQWQTPIGMGEPDCLASIDVIRPWLYNIHAFSWEGMERLPLGAKAESWKKYLKAMSGNRVVLLEFVQDDDPHNLLRDAEELHRLLAEID